MKYYYMIDMTEKLLMFGTYDTKLVDAIGKKLNYKKFNPKEFHEFYVKNYNDKQASYEDMAEAYSKVYTGLNENTSEINSLLRDIIFEENFEENIDADINNE